jgi:hypothetical protein
VPASALLACLVAVLVFVATSPYLFLDVEAARRFYLRLAAVLFPRLLGTLAPEETAAPAQPFPDIPGYPSPLDQPWWAGWVFHATFSLRYDIGLLPTLLAPVAIAWGLAQRSRFVLLAAATAALHYLVLGASVSTQTRYMTPIVPLLAILEAGVLASVARRFGPGTTRAGLALAVATAVLCAEPLASAVAHNRIAARTDTRVLATQWMTEHVPRGTKVLGLGTQVWGWGMPQLPRGVRLVYVPPRPEALAAAGVGYVVAHDHVLFSSRVDPRILSALAPHLRLLTEFDPFVPGRDGDAIFEARDAYYIPMHGFGAVTRPGPRVRIYGFSSGAG